MSEEPNTPTTVLLKLYRPCHFHLYTFNIRKLNPYVSCDTRGSGTIYNTKIGRYYLLKFPEKFDACLSINDIFSVYTNDTELRKDHCHTFRSTSNKINSNYLIGTFLTFVFSLNRQFPKHTINKYFKRLRQLLQDKLSALNNRLSSKAENLRKTTTYIRFSFEGHVIYLGFYIRCGTSCPTPAAFVMSQHRWRCGAHLGCASSIKHMGVGLPKDPKFYRSQTYKKVNQSKDIHSNRLGVGYTVTLKKYTDKAGRENPGLKAMIENKSRMDQANLLGTSVKRLYYKQYSNIRFDIVRSPQQIARWNRLTYSNVLVKKLSNVSNGDTNNNSRLNFKQISHLPEKFNAMSGIAQFPYSFMNQLDMDDLPLGLRNATNGRDMWRWYRRQKNWLRRVRSRNKAKFKLPPLPPNFNFKKDVRIYYKERHNIDLFNYQVRRQYDVSSIPYYNYDYDRAVTYYNLVKSRKAMRTIQDVSLTANANNAYYSISNSDRKIINDKNVFLSRYTPPPEDMKSSSPSDTLVDSSATSIIYPPTPARDV